MKIILIAIIILSFILGYLLKKKYPSNKTKHIVNVVNILLIVLLLELTLFNINSYRLMDGDYERREYSVGMKQEGKLFRENEDEIELETLTMEKEITGINTEIATVKINASSYMPIKYTVYYTDETSGEYRELPSKMLATGVEGSYYIPCFLSGKTEKLKVVLEYENVVPLEFESIVINEKIPFNFNMWRVLILSAIAIFVYLLLNLPIFNKPYEKSNRSQKVILILIGIVFVIILNWCAQVTVLGHIKYGKRYTEEYVDALMAGQISLLDEPSEELKQMENPYDPTLRIENEVEAKWDIAYYEGKYYVYFGIAPAITMLIPYKLIVGDYMPAITAMLIYLVLSVIFIIKLLSLMFRKWFSKLPFKLLVISVIMVLMGSMMLFLASRPDMYEIVIAAALYFVLQGIFFVLKAIEKEKVNYIYLCLGCISLALSVACRPTALLVSIIIIPILINILRKNVKEKKNILKFLLVVGIPYAFVGIGLMIFNYIRFDSIFEFGASYQLTVYDMRNMAYRLFTIPMGVISYLFALPITTIEFPFVNTTEDLMAFYGHYANAPMHGGIFILNPILFALLFIPKIKKHIPKELFSLIVGLVSVGFIMVVLEVMMGGSYGRYTVDFAWIFLVAAVLVIWAIYKIVQSEQLRKYIFGALVIIMLCSGGVNFLISGIQGEQDYLEKMHAETYYAIRYAVSFWE